MERYNIIENKNKREIVLLQGFPCKWGKCSFCDYILDNSENRLEMIKLNEDILDKVDGIYDTLEVINSGSCFELPRETLEKIKEVVKNKGIKKLFMESHWLYKDKASEMRDYFDIPIIFKVGVETFDYEFRNKVLIKGTDFKTIKEFKEYFDSPCIMVGVKGQTKDQIAKDIKILQDEFDHSTINIYINNTSSIKRDDKLVDWFIKEYSFLEKNPKIEILYNNTDFGVGD